MKVVIMAGGRGSRIFDLYPDLPKPLILINVVSVLEKEIISLRDRQILKALCSIQQMFCYDSPEYVKDMDTPERCRVLEAGYKNGVVNAKKLLK